jgi:para-nitrobenzyl esterase
MVWIHGGGFTSGSGDLPDFQGQTLAGGEQVVVVSMNYRLGVFGFFALPALSQESAHGVSGNYGIMDQTFALRWVRRNIASFGGDPQRVTIFGQSAGAQSVLAHYVSPLSRGLFARAIGESARYQDFGIGIWATLPLSAQEQEGEGISGRLKVTEGPGQLEALRAVSVEDLLKVTAPDTGPYPLGFVTPAQPSFQPVVDGFVIPAQVWKLMEVGAFAHVPLLIGSNAEECNMWVSSVPEDKTATVTTGARAEVAHYLGGLWPAYAALFPPALYGSVLEATSKMMTVAEFYAPARYAAHCVSRRGVPAFLYYFTQEPPGTTWGAVHCSEIPYVFGTARTAYGQKYPADARLSTTISGYWAGFATAGDPNGGGRPPWPLYIHSKERLLRLGQPQTEAIAVPYKEAADLAETAAHVH